MAATVTVLATFGLTVTEILDSTPFALDGRKTVIHDTLNFSETNSTTGVTTSVVAASNHALTSGTATIDLTAMLGTNGATVSGSGLKLQYMIARATSTNANPIKIKNGASNGYGGWGSDFAVSLKANQRFMIDGRDLENDVDGTHKTLDLSGTGSQSIDIIMVFG